MGRGTITSGGSKETSLLHYFQRGRRNKKTQLIGKVFYFVAINAKGGECWTWCYGVGIDVKNGQTWSIWY
jgi:hypothetical protein